MIRYNRNVALLILWMSVMYFGKAQEKRLIEITYGGNFIKNEMKFPKASIFMNDGEQVQFNHQGVRIWCDLALHYKNLNLMKANGNVLLKQGDSLTLKSDYIEYSGNTRMAVSKKNVSLESNNAILTTDTLYFNRAEQQAYFDTPSKIVSGENILTSNKGRYFLKEAKFHFIDDVVITNPDTKINSHTMDYFPDPKEVYYYGPTTIKGKDYVAYGERGFYATIEKTGYMVKNAWIDYGTRIVFGDSIFFDENKEYATITNNIKVIDTINNTVAKGHYGEVYKEKDSLFLTKKAVAIYLVQNDSLYIHGDKIVITEKEKEKILKAYHNVKIFKTGMSGKCDSIYSDEKTGIIKMINNPVLWYVKNQITGDSIQLIVNNKTRKLDSLKVLKNAFMIEKDSLGSGYNQTKGKNIYGLFADGEIYQIDVKKNSEVIYYFYDESDQLIGINKTTSNNIKIEITDKKLEKITFLVDPKGQVFPEKDLPKNARKLKNFNWRGEEMILTKDDIFDEDDKNIVLPKIEGIE